MPSVSNRFRLNATVLAQHFKYACDRRYRYAAVPAPLRGRHGTVGEDVPRPGERPAGARVERLLTGGNEFERDHVLRLKAEAEAAGAWMAGGDEVDNPEDNPKLRAKVAELPFPAFVAALRRSDPPRYVAQPELLLSDAAAARLLAEAGLDPERVEIGKTLPDLLEICAPTAAQPHFVIRVWDFKMSRKAKLEHFVQVAWYTFLLEAVLGEAGLDDRYVVDREQAVIVSRKGMEPFDLTPYRRALVHFLRTDGAALLDAPAREAEWHVSLRCRGCEFLEARGGCLQEAEDFRDLSRIPYLTAQAKRQLLAAGFRDHHDLAYFAEALDAPPPHGDEARARRMALRQQGHSLATHLDAYLARARALSGRDSALDLGARTLAMPQYENVRVVLSAEADGVTGTCFGLGISIVEWIDGQRAETAYAFVATTPPGRVAKDEASALADRMDEVGILYRFLRTLNATVERIHDENVRVAQTAVPEDEDVRAAEAELARLEAVAVALADERAQYKGLNRKSHPEAAARRDDLDAQLRALKDQQREAKEATKLAQRKADAARWHAAKSLHFYVYDTQDLSILRETLERQLFGDPPPELFAEMRHLVRLFPPESLLADADTFRSVPITVLTGVLRETMALRVPYGYDLRGVTEHFRATSRSGATYGYRFLPTNDFVQPRSNQVAFERIHDVWDDEPFAPNPNDPAKSMTSAQVAARIQKTIKDKLSATDSVVSALKSTLGPRLLLRKEKFRLHEGFDPVMEPTEASMLLDVLAVFVWLEESLAELAVKELHTRPAEQRAASFEAVHGMRLLREERVDDEAGRKKTQTHLTFAFPSTDRDVKFDVGSFGLVLTNEAHPEQLLWDVDGPLYRKASYPGSPYSVRLVEIDRAGGTLTVGTSDVDKLREKTGLPHAGERSSSRFVLDGSYANANTPKVLAVIDRLRAAPDAAPHVVSLLMTGDVPGWRRVGTDARVEAALADLQARADAHAAAHGRTPRPILNASQRNAFVRGFTTPLGLVWGPPGTGKTHTIAHQLLGHALVAKAEGRRLRVLVSAFTHHAIATVLDKVAALAEAYGLADEIRVAKVRSGSSADVDDALPAAVERLDADGLAARATDEDDSRALMVGATVYGVYAAMKDREMPAPWFDVLLVDEASQMRVPEALMVLAATAPTASVLLAGDDMQLAPIIQGSYPDSPYLSSIFSFARSRMDERIAAGDAAAKDAMLFLLRENFRMNEPLTAYPRAVLYTDGYDAYHLNASQRIALASPEPDAFDPLTEALLDPERPVVLVRYTPPRAYGARNDVEARLAAQLATQLAERLFRPDGVLYRASEGEGLPGEDFAREGLALLAPHRAQNALIRHYLREAGFAPPTKASPGKPATLPDGARAMPLVDTVEKLQGKERDVVIVSYGVADAEYAEAEAHFLLSKNRFNVAVTRARRKLIVLLSDAVIETLPTDREVLLEGMMLKEFSTYCQSATREEVYPWKDEEGQPLDLRVSWRTFDDG